MGPSTSCMTTVGVGIQFAMTLHVFSSGLQVESQTAVARRVPSARHHVAALRMNLMAVNRVSVGVVGVGDAVGWHRSVDLPVPLGSIKGRLPFPPCVRVLTRTRPTLFHAHQATWSCPVPGPR